VREGRLTMIGSPRQIDAFLRHKQHTEKVAEVAKLKKEYEDKEKELQASSHSEPPIMRRIRLASSAIGFLIRYRLSAIGYLVVGLIGYRLYPPRRSTWRHIHATVVTVL
jgi:predicted acetyltransferase